MSGDDPQVLERQVSTPPLISARTGGPGTTGRRRWPWLIAAAALALYVGASVAYPPDAADLWFQVMFSSVVGAVVLVGALLTVRVEQNPIGPLLLLSGSLTATTIAIGTWAIVVLPTGVVPAQVLALAGIVNDLGFTIAIAILLIFVPLIFPDGRLLSSRWRWIVAMVATALGAVALTTLLTPGTLAAIDLENPFGVPGLEPLLAALDSYADLAAIVGFIAAMLAVVIRFRRGASVERQQLKWLIAVAAVAAVAFPVAFVVPSPVIADAALFVGFIPLFAMPLAIGIAILRYRLYDIDQIISRTIAWALISGVLLGAFVVLVVGLQAALTGFTGGETLAVAMSTLGACALFQPVRARVQRAVDRRFDRARYDSQRTAHAFAERLRDDVDLDALASELRETAIGAIRPVSAGIWLADRSTGRE